MKLMRVHIISAETCGGLLDGLDIRLRSASAAYRRFEPLCLVGPNGSGKSQFLQIVAEIFQSICHTCARPEERLEANPELLFEVEYLIKPEKSKVPVHVRARRVREGKMRAEVLLERQIRGEWVACDMQAEETRNLLPKKIVGYTSGGNETLSLPFLVSRSA